MLSCLDAAVEGASASYHFLWLLWFRTGVLRHSRRHSEEERGFAVWKTMEIRSCSRSLDVVSFDDVDEEEEKLANEQTNIGAWACAFYVTP